MCFSPQKCLWNSEILSTQKDSLEYYMLNENENYTCTLVYFGKEYIKVFVGLAYQGKDILFRFIIECI
jgi:hypothetical protein